MWIGQSLEDFTVKKLGYKQHGQRRYYFSLPPKPDRLWGPHEWTPVAEWLGSVDDHLYSVLRLRCTELYLHSPCTFLVW